MRKKTSILLLSLALVIMATPAVMARAGGKIGGGLGIGGQMGVNCKAMGGGGTGFGSRSDLNLTPEQEEKLLNIRQELVKDTLELQQKLQRNCLELRRLWETNPPNQTAINQKMAEMTPLRIELNNKKRQAQEEMENVLTPEQLEKFKSRQQHSPGRGRRLGRGRW